MYWKQITTPVYKTLVRHGSINFCKVYQISNAEIELSWTGQSHMCLVLYIAYVFPDVQDMAGDYSASID